MTSANAATFPDNVDLLPSPPKKAMTSFCWSFASCCNPASKDEAGDGDHTDVTEADDETIEVPKSPTIALYGDVSRNKTKQPPGK